MEAGKVIQGRCITSATVAQIRGMMVANPSWHRTRLSRELCARWDWRNDNGRLKDMACRTLLLKLERLGEIHLPARQRPSQNANRNRSISELPHDCSPIESDLHALQPLTIQPLASADRDALLFKYLLHRYHDYSRGSLSFATISMPQTDDSPLVYLSLTRYKSTVTELDTHDP